MSAPVIDRLAIETLFAVSRRQAVRILEKLGAFTLGHALVIDRLELIGKLEQIARGDTHVGERRRRERLDDELKRVRREQRARQVAIRAAPPRPAGLPSGVALAPGRLEVEFGSIEDLLGKLLGLARAISQDLDRYREMAG
jgi:hypothetical protein